MQGSGFKVEGSGIRVQGLGLCFRATVIGALLSAPTPRGGCCARQFTYHLLFLRVQRVALRCKVQGVGFRV